MNVINKIYDRVLNLDNIFTFSGEDQNNGINVKEILSYVTKHGIQSIEALESFVYSGIPTAFHPHNEIIKTIVAILIFLAFLQISYIALSSTFLYTSSYKRFIFGLESKRYTDLMQHHIMITDPKLFKTFVMKGSPLWIIGQLGVLRYKAEIGFNRAIFNIAVEFEDRKIAPYAILVRSLNYMLDRLFEHIVQNYVTNTLVPAVSKHIVKTIISSGLIYCIGLIGISYALDLIVTEGKTLWLHFYNSLPTYIELAKDNIYHMGKYIYNFFYSTLSTTESTVINSPEIIEKINLKEFNFSQNLDLNNFNIKPIEPIEKPTENPIEKKIIESPNNENGGYLFLLANSLFLIIIYFK